jgi:alpha-L-arabinofuranosidase
MRKKYLPYICIGIAVFTVGIIIALVQADSKEPTETPVKPLSSSESSTLTASDALILSYNFDEQNGNTVVDSSGKGNDGELIDGAKISFEDENQGKLILNGKGYVELPKNILKGLKEITVSTWVKFSPNTAAMSEWQRVFDFGKDTNNYLFLSKNKRFSLSVGGRVNESTGNSAAKDNQWIHIAITIGNNEMIYYENGVEIGRVDGMRNNIGQLSSTTGHFIGKSKFTADAILKGEIDSFYIYNTALSEEEVKNVMRYSLTDKQAVNMIRQSLTVEGLEEITSDLILPASTDIGVNIKWISNSKYIDDKGIVSRPEGTSPEGISLTAELARGNVINKMEFRGSVLPKGMANYTLDIDTDKTQFEISPLLIGAFYEDINHAADGGLYAELIENRSFEFKNNMDSWKLQGDITTKSENPLNSNNSTFVRVSSKEEGKESRLTNDGFKGITVKAGSKYDFSIWMRPVNGYHGEVYAELQDENGVAISNIISLKPSTDEWSKYEEEITASTSTSKAILAVYSKTKGSVDLDMISLFPQDTWKGRKYGLRKDLAQLLTEMQPKFLRFPGGCIVEGNSAENMYNWKDTIGPVEERKENTNLWGYYQSYGLGFYEYFTLAEDMGSEPLPVVNVGMTCQARGGGSVPEESLDRYIQDALDLIEYANGAVNTTWGKKRAEAGHPLTFNLKYLAVGNEQWGNEYFRNFMLFKKAINEKYPEIMIISAAGPHASGDLINQAWSFVNKNAKDTIVDEHYYMDPNWFLTNVDRYDSYDRNSAEVFVGEYASQSNTFRSALGEAAYITGIEKNSDIVKMASYAPLFAKADDFQWNPNLIWFNGETSYGSPNYYVQKLFSTNTGTDLLSWDLVKYDGKKQPAGLRDLYVSSSYDKASKEVIIKIVNVTAVSKEIMINLKGTNSIDSSASLQIITSNNIYDTNTFSDPQKIAIEDKELKGISDSFNYTAGKYSISVIRVKVQ